MFETTEYRQPEQEDFPCLGNWKTNNNTTKWQLLSRTSSLPLIPISITQNGTLDTWTISWTISDREGGLWNDLPAMHEDGI